MTIHVDDKRVTVETAGDGWMHYWMATKKFRGTKVLLAGGDRFVYGCTSHNVALKLAGYLGESAAR